MPRLPEERIERLKREVSLARLAEMIPPGTEVIV